MKASESAREAAMRLLDQQAIRFHKDGTFRDWDNTVQAFTQAEARGRAAHNAAIIAMLDNMKTEASELGQTDAVFWIVQIKRDIAALIPGEPA